MALSAKSRRPGCSVGARASVRWRGWLLALVGLSACAAPRHLPPPPLPVRSTQPATPRPLWLGVLPVVDARLPGEPADKKGRYIYRGRQYHGTRLEALGPEALTQLSQRWAGRLAAEGRFERVVFATRPEAAPNVQLWLRLRLVRLRGYVEAAPAPGQAPRVLGEAHWEAAVQGPGGRWLDAELGWAVDAPRAGARDPWAVLVEGLDATYQQLQAALVAMSGGPTPARVRLPPIPSTASTSGPSAASTPGPSTVATSAPSAASTLGPSTVATSAPSAASTPGPSTVATSAPSTVATSGPSAASTSAPSTLGPSAASTPGPSAAALSARPGPASHLAAGLRAPPGWRLHRHQDRRPEGWGGPPCCEAWAFVMVNSPRYNRRWGRHLPTVWLWRCPRGDRRRLRSRAERFARLLGSDAEAVYFGRVLGRHNWPAALSQIAAALSLTPPPRRFLTDTQQLAPRALLETGPSRPAPRSSPLRRPLHRPRARRSAPASP